MAHFSFVLAGPELIKFSFEFYKIFLGAKVFPQLLHLEVNMLGGVDQKCLKVLYCLPVTKRKTCEHVTHHGTLDGKRSPII